MKSVAVLLFSLAAANAAKLIDYRLAVDPTPEPVKKCTRTGLLCESCTSLVACMADGENFTKTAVDTCDYPQKCVGSVCTENIADPFCDHIADLPFMCQAVGIFPDPFYCNKFVFCVEIANGSLQAFSNKCDEGYGYSASTAMCSVKLVNNECTPGDYAVPLCEKDAAGKTGALDGNPSLYYICRVRNVKINGTDTDVLYPVLSECPHGQVYSNFNCVDEGDDGNDGDDGDDSDDGNNGN